MKAKSTVILLCLLTLFLVRTNPAGLFARDLEKYRGEITIPIVENDLVYARNNAFQTLQNLLLAAAIEDLIGETLYAEYKDQIDRNQAIKPSDFLVSAKVIKEFSEADAFTMELEGIIQLSTLANELRKMDLILKDEPFKPVHVVFSSDFRISVDQLKQRLSVFHITISSFSFVDTTGIPADQRNNERFAQTLFSAIPKARIIYFIDTLPGKSQNSVQALRAQIFRRSDSSLLSTIQLDLPREQPFHSLDDSTISSFLKLFSIASLEIDRYDEGTESTIVLRVEGLIDPFNRRMFEEKVLKPERAIKSFTLDRMSSKVTQYSIYSNYSLEELESFFKQDNPDFYFITEKGESGDLTVEAFYRYKRDYLALTEWEPDQRILNLISETLYPEAEDPDLEPNRSDLFDHPIEEHLIPQYVETEPNNKSQTLNRVPPETLILGYISSRADEDVFRLIRNVDASTLIVEWIRIGKTTLSPQLRLYDQRFDFINNYNLIGQQNKLKFQYTFKDKAPRHLYLRITDKVGFIQGETGGFKSFHYLLRYSWAGSNQILNSSLMTP